MMGDFNLPNIDRESWNNKSDNTEAQDYNFTQCIQDNVLYQHVNKPIRWRGTDTPHVLDLVFTNEENMVSEKEYLSSLGKSDHCVLQFQFNCYTKLKIERRQKMCYDKGNCAKFNKEVTSIKWKEFINPSDHIDRNWATLYSRLMELEKRYMPNRNIDHQIRRKEVIYRWIRKQWIK